MRIDVMGKPLYVSSAHRAARAAMAPLVASGRAECTEPVCLMRSRAIVPGTPWDAAHNRRTGGYRGPAHRRCNRSEGATYGNRQRGRRRHGGRPRTSTSAAPAWASRTW